MVDGICYSHPVVGIDNPPVPKIDAQVTENLDKASFS
jgi:hypothetical protein